MKNKLKGFTLIELLVVIAIIGILAGMIFISMSSPTNKAYDARIKSDLDQIRTKATILYDDEDDYANVSCAGDAGITSLCTDINSTYSTDHDITIFRDSTASDGAVNSAYCGYVNLSTGNKWCIDYKFGYQDVGAANPTHCTQAACDVSTGADNCTCN